MQQDIHNEERISTDQNIAYGLQTLSVTSDKHSTFDMIQEIYDDTVIDADSTQQSEIYEELDVQQIESPIAEDNNVLVSLTQGTIIIFCFFN